MPSSVFFGMQHLNQNLMVSIGINTTNPDPEYGDLCEICVLPISHMLKPHPELILFNMKMKPLNPDEYNRAYSRVGLREYAELVETAIEKDMVAEHFRQWFEAMDMPKHKKLIPLAYDAAYTIPVLRRWLGQDVFEEIFRDDYRDVRCAAHYLNDRADVVGEAPPFTQQNLTKLARDMGVQQLETGGSPCSDALATLEVYKRLLQLR